jgi:tRNA(adenine34) deaminase
MIVEGDGLPASEPHEHYMRIAIQLARETEEAGEVPVGCVIVHQGRIIGAAANQREMLRDPTAHAEMLAITQAAEALNDWRLSECSLYATLEPCPMCAGAIINARVPRVIYGAADPKAGAAGTLFNLLTDPRLNHRCQVFPGVLAGECGQLLSDFFRRQRALGKK